MRNIKKTISKKSLNLIRQIKVTNNLDEFISRSEIIIANRLDENLIKVREKVFTRDLYGKN